MKVKEIIARYKAKGKKFEILLNWYKYNEYLKHPDKVDISEIVIGDGLFEDIRRAERAKEKDIKAVFGDKDFYEICKIILKEGEIQLTEEQRKELIEEKRRKIVNFITTHAIDAQTNLPFTPTRVEHALESVKFRVDPLKSVEKQIEEAISALRSVLPIKIESKIYEIRCTLDIAGKMRNELSRLGKIKSEDWGSSYYICHIEIPAGLIDNLFGVVNKLTKGEGFVREIKRGV